MDKRIVAPGELVTSERKKLGAGVFVEQGNVYSEVLGITYPDSDTASVVPLRGGYLPKRGDIIVAIVTDQNHAGYLVNISPVGRAFVHRDVSRQDLNLGAIISGKIVAVDEMNEVQLEDVRVLFGGRIVEVKPVKIPRIVGKQGSMLNVLKEGTGSIIVAGRNGRVWLKNGDVKLAEAAIRKIEEIAHESNVTQSIQEFLQNERKGMVK